MHNRSGQVSSRCGAAYLRLGSPTTQTHSHASTSSSLGCGRRQGQCVEAFPWRGLDLLRPCSGKSWSAAGWPFALHGQCCKHCAPCRRTWRHRVSFENSADRCSASLLYSWHCSPERLGHMGSAGSLDGAEFQQELVDSAVARELGQGAPASRCTIVFYRQKTFACDRQGINSS
jgi:hypothetical protein